MAADFVCLKLIKSFNWIWILDSCTISLLNSFYFIFYYHFRQDPLIKLRKQLEDKEKQLTSEKEISKGIQAKLTDLRSELNAEKHKARHLEETVNMRTTELQNYAMRFKQINDEKVTSPAGFPGGLCEIYLHTSMKENFNS